MSNLAIYEETTNVTDAIRKTRIAGISNESLKTESMNVINGMGEIKVGMYHVASALSKIRKMTDEIKKEGYKDFNAYCETTLGYQKAMCNRMAQLGDTLISGDKTIIAHDDKDYSVSAIGEVAGIAKTYGVDAVKEMDASGKISPDMTTKEMRKAALEFKAEKGDTKAKEALERMNAKAAEKEADKTEKVKVNVSRETKTEEKKPEYEPIPIMDSVSFNEDNVNPVNYMIPTINGMVSMANYAIYDGDYKKCENTCAMAIKLMNMFKAIIPDEAYQQWANDIAATRDDCTKQKNAR